MTPDLYAAWLAAGAWTARNWTNLALAAVLALAACLIWQALRDASRRVEAALGEGGDQPPGRDVGLYLAHLAAYGDNDELAQLREALEQHRKEDRP